MKEKIKTALTAVEISSITDEQMSKIEAGKIHDVFTELYPDLSEKEVRPKRLAFRKELKRAEVGELARKKPKCFGIEVTADSVEEKEHVREVFKKNGLSMAKFVMEKIREKVDELEGME